MNKNVKASSWYLIGNLFDKAIAFLTIPIFTRLLSTTDYGIENTYISYVTILTIVLGLSMESSIQSDLLFSTFDIVWTFLIKEEISFAFISILLSS